ncbi:hypothetical protein [Vibrio sp. TRT 1302]|uniref:hypothetical protein n=1 Tax=Vibrio sp. TRT 1302 TaxID=3418504 RepID=UPI003CEEEC61
MKYLAYLRKNNGNQILSLVLNESKKDGIEEVKKVKDRITIAYDNYNGFISRGRIEPEKLTLKKEKKFLVNFYSPTPVCISNYLDKRRHHHGLLECPFCGYPFSPDTLDHFLPKNDWPEFSILLNNLVPQCRNCAPIKGDDYYCKDNKDAMFLHPMYYKSLSEVNFVIDVEFDDSSNMFDFDIYITLPENLRKNKYICSRISSHFKALKIKSRVVSYCHSEVKHWENLLRSKYFDLNKSLEATINERVASDIHKNWKTALYIGIKSNDKAMEYLHSLRPEVKTTTSFPKKSLVRMDI